MPILLEGLKKLEYRGYDSAGVCVATPKPSAKEGAAQDGKLTILKRKGKVLELEKVIGNWSLEIGNSQIGIAHTRWATHGEPSEINAHPHLDCKQEIAVVHNGIIENYAALKELLKKEGHQFVSQTDSEVLAHLIEKFYTNNLEDAVKKALALAEN